VFLKQHQFLLSNKVIKDTFKMVFDMYTLAQG
jgi:hypothetical protein